MKKFIASDPAFVQYFRINYPYCWGFGLHLGVNYLAIAFAINYLEIVLFYTAFNKSDIQYISKLSCMIILVVYTIHWSYRQYRISILINSFRMNFIFIGLSLIQLLIFNYLLSFQFFYDKISDSFLWILFSLYSISFVIPIVYSSISNSLKCIIVTIFSAPIFFIILIVFMLLLSILNINVDFDKFIGINALVFTCFVVPFLIITLPIKKYFYIIRPLYYSFFGLIPNYTVFYFGYKREDLKDINIYYILSIFLYIIIILALGYTKLQKIELYPKKY